MVQLRRCILSDRNLMKMGRLSDASIRGVHSRVWSDRRHHLKGSSAETGLRTALALCVVIIAVFMLREVSIHYKEGIPRL